MSWPFTPKYSRCIFLENKCILLYHLYILIKIRKLALIHHYYLINSPYSGFASCLIIPFIDQKKKVFSSSILSRIIHYNSCHVSLVSVNLEQCLSISLSFMTLMFLKTTLPQHSDHIFLPWPECFFHFSSHQWDLLLRAWHFNKALLTLVRGSSLYSIHCLH